MTFKEYILTKYDVRDKIKQLKSNPIDTFMDSDIFPCDFVEMDGNRLVKMLYFADGQREIPVLDLLSYKREELVKINDKELLDFFDLYTSQFKFDSDSILSILHLSEIRNNSLNSIDNQ